MQLSRTTPTSALIDNAASSTIRGVEVEATAYLTDELAIDLGLGILDGKYGVLSSINTIDPTATLQNLSGNKIPRMPNVTLNAGLEYTMRIGDLGELKSRGEYNYTGKQYFTQFNEAVAKQDGYSVFNAIFTFTPDDCALAFKVYGRNLGNKGYRNGMGTYSPLFNSYGNWAPPRTFGAEVTAKF